MLNTSLWPGTEVAHWLAFVQMAAEIVPPTPRPTILFRGQPQPWPLRSSLLRALPAGIDGAVALRAEKQALDHFRSQAHLYDSSLAAEASMPRSALFWWTLMQHHRAPTRLVDWTASPYVAAYFAVELCPDSDGVIYVIDADAVDASYGFPDSEHVVADDELLQPRMHPTILTITPALKTTRLVAQQGYFTVSSAILAEHDQLLADAGAILRRWIIPASVKPHLLHHLHLMNVAANSLFPGLDGLGRSTAEVIRLAAA